MKKVWKSLAVLTALLAFFGWGFVSCGDDNNDDGDVAVKSVSVSPTQATIAVSSETESDKSVTLTATLDPANATEKTIYWTVDEAGQDKVELSANTGSSITVTAKAAGTATVTATTKDGNKTAQATITVVAAKVEASATTVAGTYSIELEDGAVTITLANGKVLDEDGDEIGTYTVDENGTLTVTVTGVGTFTADTNIDGTIDTDSVKDEAGNNVSFEAAESEATDDTPQKADAAVLTVPWTVELKDGYVAAGVEYGAFVAGKNDGCYNTSGATLDAPAQNKDGLYFYADANGFKEGDADGGIEFYFYGNETGRSDDDDNTGTDDLVGGTHSTVKSAIALKASQLTSAGAKSIKTTITAKALDSKKGDTVINHLPIISILDTNKKVLALQQISKEKATYTFYLPPAQAAYIVNGAVSNTHFIIYEIKTEADTATAPADGTVPITGITLATTGVDAGADIAVQSTGNVVLTANVSPATATPIALEWNSSDTDVTVTPATDTKSATVTYVAGKTPVITVTDKNGTASAKATITFKAASNAITSIDVAEASIDLYNNEAPKATLAATILPADTDNDSLTWEITEGEDIISFTSATAAAANTTSAVTMGTTNATSSVDVYATGKAGTATIKVSGGNVTDKTVTVTVKASAVTNGKYDFNKAAANGGLRDSLVNGATSIPDGSFRWNANGLVTSNNYWISTSANTVMEIDVAGPTVVSFESYGGSSYNAAMTVTEGTNTLVNNVKSTDTTVAFLYSGTTATTLKIAFGGAHYFRSVTISDGTGKTNTVSVKVDGDTSVAIGDQIELTATLSNAYINTDSTPVQTVTWTPESSDYFDISISDDTLTATIKGKSSTTDKVTVTATSNATADSSASKDIEVTATAAATVDSVWAMGELGCYSDANFETSTGSTEVNNSTAYIKGTNSKIALYVDATSAKLSQNTSGYAQMNKDTKIYVPVSAGSVITVNCRDSTYNENSVPTGLTVGGVAQKTTTTVFNVGSSAGDGYVLITTTDEKDYLISIAVTQVNPKPDTARSTANLITAVTVAE